MSYYYDVIFHPALRMLRGIMQFDLPDGLGKNPSARDLVEKNFPLYAELAMLRHHGFPSPLLDWSLSPFVAAYFAFSSVPSLSTRRVAIFSYRENFGGARLPFDGSKAHVRLLGPWVPVHERHVRQQSRYTVAFRDKKGDGVEFCPHEEAITERPFKWIRFDEITKFTLPITLREEVLTDLRRMNITEYSLFDSTDALVRTVARFATSRP